MVPLFTGGTAGRTGPASVRTACERFPDLAASPQPDPGLGSGEGLHSGGARASGTQQCGAPRGPVLHGDAPAAPLAGAADSRHRGGNSSRVCSDVLPTQTPGAHQTHRPLIR